jgi:hypothetical protein
MVIECIQYRTVNSDLFKFLVENRFSNLELRLLLFWSRHPNAKLSIYTIASAMDTARINLREAISSLVKKNVLEEHQNGCGLTTYYLSGDIDTKERVDELSQLDWNQITSLKRQLQTEAILY